MNQSRSRLVDLAGLLSNVTALHTLFSIFAFRQTGRSDPAGLLIWCVCLSLTCGGLALFLRRPRTQRSILLLAAGRSGPPGGRRLAVGGALSLPAVLAVPACHVGLLLLPLL